SLACPAGSRVQTPPEAPKPRNGGILPLSLSFAGHEGRTAPQGLLNVGFLAFHEGRGARKSAP
ncbi:MAG TPA: hypothetical protein VF944_11300, partial [Candidatus Bathyarchaeia archaeon]